jgi:hypothetical protein
MFQGDLYVAERSMHGRLEERRQRLESRSLARRLGSGLHRGERFYAIALARLGQRLVALGSHLQERYSTGAAAPAPQPANRLAS